MEYVFKWNFSIRSEGGVVGGGREDEKQCCSRGVVWYEQVSVKKKGELERSVGNGLESYVIVVSFYSYS